MYNSYKIPFIPSGTCPESLLSIASGSEFGIMPDFAAINISSYVGCVGFSLAKANPTSIQIPRTSVAMTADYCHLGEMSTVSIERWNESVTGLQCLCFLVT